jgi:hypothetical protein
MVQEHPAAKSDGNDCPEEPHETMSHDEVEAALEAVSIPADDDTDVSESQVQIEVLVVSQDTTGATAPSGR